MFSKNETLKVKGVAILLLVFHHLFYDISQIENNNLKFLLTSSEQIQPLAITARICVWIFVFLSAYGLTYQYNKNQTESTVHFIIKHWISLIRTYWFAYIIVFTLYWCIGENPLSIYTNSKTYLILDFMGWADFFQTPMLTGVWWYMCFAQILIIGIPALDFLCEKFSIVSFALGFLILQYLPVGIHSLYGGRYSLYFLVAILGTWCAKEHILDRILYRNNNNNIANNLIHSSIFGIFIIILLTFKYKFSEIDQWQINTAVSAIAAFCIIVWISKYCTNRTVCKLFIFLGNHSANIFMIHAFFYTKCGKLIYASHLAILSYITLIFISLLFSVIMEFIKNKIQYNEKVSIIIQWIIQKFLNVVNG